MLVKHEVRYCACGLVVAVVVVGFTWLLVSCRPAFLSGERLHVYIMMWCTWDCIDTWEKTSCVNLGQCPPLEWREEPSITLKTA